MLPADTEKQYFVPITSNAKSPQTEWKGNKRKEYYYRDKRFNNRLGTTRHATLISSGVFLSLSIIFLVHKCINRNKSNDVTFSGERRSRRLAYGGSDQEKDVSFDDNCKIFESSVASNGDNAVGSSKTLSDSSEIMGSVGFYDLCNDESEYESNEGSDIDAAIESEYWDRGRRRSKATDSDEDEEEINLRRSGSDEGGESNENNVGFENRRVSNDSDGNIEPGHDGTSAGCGIFDRRVDKKEETKGKESRGVISLDEIQQGRAKEQAKLKVYGEERIKKNRKSISLLNVTNVPMHSSHYDLGAIAKKSGCASRRYSLRRHPKSKKSADDTVTPLKPEDKSEVNVIKVVKDNKVYDNGNKSVTTNAKQNDCASHRYSLQRHPKSKKSAGNTASSLESGYKGVVNVISSVKDNETYDSVLHEELRLKMHLEHTRASEATDDDERKNLSDDSIILRLIRSVKGNKIESISIENAEKILLKILRDMAMDTLRLPHNSSDREVMDSLKKAAQPFHKLFAQFRYWQCFVKWEIRHRLKIPVTRNECPKRIDETERASRRLKKIAISGNYAVGHILRFMEKVQIILIRLRRNPSTIERGDIFMLERVLTEFFVWSTPIIQAAGIYAQVNSDNS